MVKATIEAENEAADMVVISRASNVARMLRPMRLSVKASQEHANWLPTNEDDRDPLPDENWRTKLKNILPFLQQRQDGRNYSRAEHLFVACDGGVFSLSCWIRLRSANSRACCYTLFFRFAYFFCLRRSRREVD